MQLKSASSRAISAGDFAAFATGMTYVIDGGWPGLL
jgi:hypothetical protein